MEKYAAMPGDVYRRTMEIAKAYPFLRKRRREFEGVNQIYQAKINLWQINAVEDAWQYAAVDEFERSYIAKNIFDGLPMHHIDVPLSASAMKRCRRRFLEQLAVNLGFI